MNTPLKDEPAFPVRLDGPVADGVDIFGTPLPGASSNTYTGMTLRDHFAGKALSGWLASFGPSGAPQNLGELAKFAYEIADAMLKARNA